MRDPMQAVPRAGDSSLWYNMCLATIGVSALLYLTGRRQLAVFVGLWPPTFAALGNRAEVNEELVNLASGQPIQRIGDGRITRQLELQLPSGGEAAQRSPLD